MLGEEITMPLAVMVVALCFLGVVTFALHRRRNVSVSMSILRRLFEFTINAKDTPPLGNAVNSAYWSKEIQHGKPVPGVIRGGFIIDRKSTRLNSSHLGIS